MASCVCVKETNDLADNPVMVISAYIAAFLPLAFIYALDFITEKWKSIKKTRRDGLVHIFSSLPPLGILVFYIHLQRVSKDYKEMATAITAAIFCIFHVMRTIWGLVQLQVYKKWNMRALYHMARIGYEAPKSNSRTKINRPIRGRHEPSGLTSGGRFPPSFTRFSLINCLRNVRNRLRRDTAPHLDQRPNSASSETSSGHFSMYRTYGGAEGISNVTAESNGLAQAYRGHLQARLAKMLADVLSLCRKVFRLGPDSHSERVEHRLNMNDKTGSVSKNALSSSAVRFAADVQFITADQVADSVALPVTDPKVVQKNPLLSGEEIESTIDHDMMVNSSLVDNEFFSSELPFRIAVWPLLRSAWRSEWRFRPFPIFDHVVSKMPEECAVQWFVSFLSRFGTKWLKDTATFPQISPFGKAKEDQSTSLDILSKLHITRETKLSGSDEIEHVSCLSPSHVFCSKPLEIFSPVVEIRNRDCLPIDIQEPLKINFDHFQASIRDAIVSWHTKSLHELSEAERDAASKISPYQLACFVKIVEENNAHYVPHGGEGTVSEIALDNYFEQIGYEPEGDPEAFFNIFPAQEEFTRLFLWHGSSFENRLILQASVHVDNWLALEAGKVGKIFQASVGSFRTESPGMSVFEIEKEFEMRRLRFDPNMYLTLRHVPKFLGCVTESVRSFLALCVYPWNRVGTWTPHAPNDTVPIHCSNQLCSAMTQDWEMDEESPDDGKIRSMHMRILWELQSAMHCEIVHNLNYERWTSMRLPWEELSESSIEDDGSSAEDSDSGGQASIAQSPIPGMLPLMMLCVLGFPSLVITKVRNDSGPAGMADTSPATNVCLSSGDTCVNFCSDARSDELAYVYNIEAFEAPGKPVLVFKYTPVLREASVQLQLAGGQTSFDWQKWKDVFMGRVCAQSEWRSTRLFSQNEKLRTEASASVISDPLPINYRKMKVWNGWPPFLPQIALFEIRALWGEPFGIPDSDELRIRVLRLEKAQWGSDIDTDTQADGSSSSSHSFSSSSDESSSNGSSSNSHSLSASSDFSSESSSDGSSSSSNPLAASSDASSIDESHPEENGDTLYSQALTLLHNDEEDKAIRILMRCVSDYGHAEALRAVMQIALSEGSAKMERMESLLDSIFQGILFTSSKIYGNYPSPSWFDPETLVGYLDNIHERTMAPETFYLKGVALFHSTVLGEPTDDRCIQALEAYLTLGKNPFFLSRTRLYLALAYHRSYLCSGRLDDENSAIQYLVRFAKENSNYRISLSVGALLEKGSFFRYSDDKLNALANILLGFETNVKKVMEYLFIRPPLPDTEYLNDLMNSVQVEKSYGNAVIGGTQSALAVYRYIVEKDDAVTAPLALNRMALLYHRGEIVTKNLREAEAMYRKSIDRQNVDAICNMGVLHQSRESGGNEFRLAAEYLEKAVLESERRRKVHSTALNNLAILLEHGTGMEKDVGRALNLYTTAVAYDENPMARFNLAMLLKFGDQSHRDCEQASELFESLLTQCRDIFPMKVLVRQVLKASAKPCPDVEGVCVWRTELQEFGDCLAMVKIVDETK